MGASQSQPKEDVVTQINETETQKSIVSSQEAISPQEAIVSPQDYTSLDWFWPVL